MERLTEKVIGGYQLKIPKDTELSDVEIKFAAYDKLGAYEDLEKQCIEENQCGLRELFLKWKEFSDDIAELYEYRKAEEQGLLLRLKANAGDTVYIIVGKDISPQKIVEIRISSGNGTEFVTNRRTFHKSAFGETVFLTREEAKSALAELRSTEATHMSR